MMIELVAETEVKRKTENSEEVRNRRTERKKI
jgi:hypothetical protein